MKRFMWLFDNKSSVVHCSSTLFIRALFLSIAPHMGQIHVYEHVLPILSSSVQRPKEHHCRSSDPPTVTVIASFFSRLTKMLAESSSDRIKIFMSWRDAFFYNILRPSASFSSSVKDQKWVVFSFRCSLLMLLVPLRLLLTDSKRSEDIR